VSEHAAWDELAAGYSLHALEPADEQAFVDHLRQCADCERTLDQHQQVAARLADLCDEEQPPSELWTAIHGSLQVQPAPAAAPPLRAVPTPDERTRPEPSPDEPTRPEPSPDEAVPAGSTGRTPLLHRLRSPLAAAAAVVVAAAVGVGSWQAVERTGGSAANVQTLTSQCQADHDCDVVAMTAHGKRRAVFLVRGQHARLLTPGLSKLSGDQTYVLWQLSRGGSPTGVAAFSSSGSQPQSVSLPVPTADTSVYGVSKEHGHQIPSTPSKMVAAAPATS
jgi:anti-sigma-K factor RskA